MPRYVIETDETIDECWKCPCLFVSDNIKRCLMAKSTIDPYGKVCRYGRDMGFDDGRDSRPSWCPLQPLEVDVRCRDM